MVQHNSPRDVLRAEENQEHTLDQQKSPSARQQIRIIPQRLRDGIWLRLAQTFAATVSRSAYARRYLSARQFYSSLRLWSSADIMLLQTALELLYATRGQISINVLASHCCLSLRQFERRFQRRMGVTPKVFARLLRFEAARDSLLGDASLSLKEVASQSGYQDQAHLIREFKIWADCTPGMFLARASERSRSGYLLLPDPRPVFSMPMLSL